MKIPLIDNIKTLENPLTMANVKQFLGIILSSILIMAASFGYISTFAKAADITKEIDEIKAAQVKEFALIRETQTAQALTHSKDTKMLKQALVQNAIDIKKETKKQNHEILIKGYTQKIQIINLNPEQTPQDGRLLKYYGVLKKDEQKQLEAL